MANPDSDVRKCPKKWLEDSPLTHLVVVEYDNTHLKVGMLNKKFLYEYLTSKPGQIGLEIPLNTYKEKGVYVLYIPKCGITQQMRNDADKRAVAGRKAYYSDLLDAAEKETRLLGL